MTTGERLTELRNKLGFSQEQMADELGVKRSTYAKWEKDTNQPTRKLKDIAAYFHVSTDYILGNTDIPNQPPKPQDQDLLRKKEIPGTALSAEETELLQKYRQVDSTKKASIQNFVNYLYIQEQQDRKEQEGA